MNLTTGNTKGRMSHKKGIMVSNQASQNKDHQARKSNPKMRQIEEGMIIDFDNPNINFRKIFNKYYSLFSYVSKFSELVKKNEDPYDIVRKYVDFIQDKKFNIIVNVIINERYKKNINKALLLERWAIFCTFYIYLDQRMIDKQKIIKNFANHIYQNILLCILLFKYEISLLNDSYTQYSSHNNLIKRIKEIFNEQIENNIKNKKVLSLTKIDRKNILFSLGKNNNNIQEQLEEISQNTSLKIKNGILGLSDISYYYLDETLEFLLDTFCDYFLDKGIVSVEYSDSTVKKNSLSVPFITTPIKNREYTLVLGILLYILFDW